MPSKSVTPGATDRLRDQHTLTRRPLVRRPHLVVDEITRDPDDDDTLPVIVGRVWDDRAHGPIAGTLQLPIAGASIHIY